MTPLTVGVVDYGVGNHASVIHCLRQLDLRACVSKEREVLDAVDVLLLPGVGAFPTAMRELELCGLADYLKEQAQVGRPIVGICLGMQLLASVSWEYQRTAGLNLVPGEIVPFAEGRSHIGWNTLEVVKPYPMMQPSGGEAFYFNHSFYFRGTEEFQFAHTFHDISFASIIRHGNVVGLQFHPEKSQMAGRNLLRNLIAGFADA